VFPDREHFGRIFYNQATHVRQGIPQIAAVLGSCTAGGAYVPAMSDEAVIVRNQGTIFLGGPPLVKAATGEVVTPRTSAAATCTRKFRRHDHLADDDRDALRIVRGSSSTLGPRPTPPWEVRADVEPRADQSELYDVSRRSASAVRRARGRSPGSSTARFARVQAEYGATLVTGFARITATRRDHRQQRRAVLRVRAEGRALHRAVRPAHGAAAVPAEHLRLHGRAATTRRAGSPSTAPRW
jgi:3-methylcrotonyl-CoA carboxylase beta subunit